MVYIKIYSFASRVTCLTKLVVCLMEQAVRLAREDELVDIVGYPRGAIGPIGSRHSATVLLDQPLLGQNIFCGTGQEGWVFDVAATTLQSLPNTVVAHIRS